MSNIVSSLFNAGSSVVQGTAKVVLVTIRVAVVSTVTTTAAVAATVVNEAKKAVIQIQSDPNIQNGVKTGKAAYAASAAYVNTKAVALETVVEEFEARHK